MLNNRFKLAISFLTGRMNEYETILRMGFENGYRMLSLHQYLQENRPPKCIILRHDIDASSPATKRMLELETRYNASASYYFRQSTMDLLLMKLIVARGGEVSLHFETLSNWAMVSNISSPEELAETEWQTICLNILNEEINDFRSLGFPCRTIAGHGHPWNYKLKTANYFITYQKDAYKKLDIDLEAYDKEFLSELDVYIMDGIKLINSGWNYGESPQDAMKRHAQRILLLTHPNHWCFSFAKACYYAMKALLFGEKHIPTKFEVD
jgi:hypothetical protein